MEKYFAIIPFGVSVFAIAGIIWPRVRAVWRGSRVKVGVLPSVGFALLFGAAGFGMLGYTHIGIPFVFGFAFIFVGQFLDFRKRRTR